MSDLISRKEAIKAVKFYETFYDPYPRVIEALEDLPSVQPEIIRCKYCKHWNNAPTSDGYNSCEKDALIRHESFFCADAKLRGEQDE